MYKSIVFYNNGKLTVSSLSGYKKKDVDKLLNKLVKDLTHNSLSPFILLELDDKPIVICESEIAAINFTDRDKPPKGEHELILILKNKKTIVLTASENKDELIKIQKNIMEQANSRKYSFLVINTENDSVLLSVNAICAIQISSKESNSDENEDKE